MISAVRSASKVRSARCTNRSDGMSSDDVASSRMSTAGSARNARGERDELALAGREARALLVHVGVVAVGKRGDEFVGADRARCSRRSPRRLRRAGPSAMLSATDPLNRKFSCVTVTIAAAQVGLG